MAAVLTQIFCGFCRRSHSVEDDEPNERTQLIRPPAGNEVLSSTSNYTIDHQKLKDRLGTIVRAKEGKMVNVNTPLPFNLHNRDIHGRRFDPSSSRSARSRSAHATLGGPTGYGPEMLPEVPSRMPSYSPTRDRDPSPSLETSGSTTSLRPGDASYLPPDVEAENGGRRPILNVRLVRGGGGYGIGGSFTSRSRQGRTVPRGRPGRADTAAVPEEAPEFNDSLNGEASHEENTQVAAEPSPSSEETSTPRAAGFNIQDVGKITCSWGD